LTSPRRAPPFWQHDAYTLKKLARAVHDAAAMALPAGRAQPAGARPRVVDLGAGEAPYRSVFEERGAEYLACDIDAAPPLRIVPGQPLPLADASAAAVVSFQVLEHVWDLDEYLGEAHRLLADDGALVLSTHGTWLYHPHPTDWRRWTRDGLLRELRSRGFEAARVWALVGPLAWTTQFRAIGYARALSALPLLGPLLAALTSSVMHLRMQIEDAVTPAPWIEQNAAVYLVLARKAPVTA
jgi:SAM-dependent methyltransferase